MLQRLLFGAPLAFVILAIFLSWRTTSPIERPPIPGRNNTVLFLTSDLTGLSNVHVAASLGLLENHPSLKVHYASFPQMQEQISRISSVAQARNPSVEPIKWHELRRTSMMTAFLRLVGGPHSFVELPGAAGLAKKVKDLSALVTVYTAEEHWAVYEELRDVVDKVDPAVVVFDHLFKPAVDLVGSVNRRFVTVSPNALLDLIADQQPWGGALWKYPAAASGYAFPVPLRLIPANIWIQLRLFYGILTAPGHSAMQAYLRERGLTNNFGLAMYPKGTPLLTSTIPEANLPMDVIPPELTACGPIVLDTAPAAEQDTDLAAWFRRGSGRTVLVNLGSLFQYNEERAKAMVGALVKVLETVEDAQVLLKFRKVGDYDEEQVLRPLTPFVEQGRLKVESWLKIDPPSLLRTGDVDLVVHHGGANSYHEAVLAGIPQVILPLWFDLYNIARTAEYLGIGIWPAKDTAPEWEADALADGILRALVGAESAALRDKAQALGKVAKGYGGRKAAADEIAKLAALGEAR